METKKAGAPKKYENRKLISFSIEVELLNRLDNTGRSKDTRNDLINRAIETYLKEVES